MLDVISEIPAEIWKLLSAAGNVHRLVAVTSHNRKESVEYDTKRLLGHFKRLRKCYVRSKAAALSCFHSCTVGR